MKLKTYTTLFSTVIMIINYNVASADETAIHGEVTARGQLLNLNGNRATLDEYYDIRDGVFGSAIIGYDTDTTYVQFNADDVGYDTQSYSLEGGIWGSYKYNLYYNESPHNLTFDAKTFYSDAGDSNLGLAGNPAAVSTWSSFDYETERDRFGGKFNIDTFKPFFLDITAQKEMRDGIKPASFGYLTGSMFEIPEPIDYQDDTFHIEAGYSKKPYFAAVSYFYDRFTNDNPTLDFYDPIFATTSSMFLPPDNHDYKLAFKGAAFLPYNSKLSLNAGTGRTKSDIDANSILNLDGFNGKYETDSLDIVLTSNPCATIDAKIFDKYYDRDDKSDDGNEDHFGYTNNVVGGQLGVKLPSHFRLTAGYTDGHTLYDNRYDAEERDDKIFASDLAWSGLEMATFKVGYEHLDRDLDRSGTDAVAEFDNLWRFDVAPADRDIYTASVDLTPVADLSLTLGYKYKNTDFKDSALDVSPRGYGLRNYKADNVFLDASYAFGTVANVYGYLDYEKVRSLEYGNWDPVTDWKLNQNEHNLDYGLGADFFVIPHKLTIKTQYDHTRSDGDADFAFLDMVTTPGSDSDDWGDYRKNAVSVKAIYDMTQAVTLAAGYAYEHYTLDDIQLDGYQYLPFGPATYLTGAYSDPTYEANVVYTSMTYKF